MLGQRRTANAAAPSTALVPPPGASASGDVGVVEVDAEHLLGGFDGGSEPAAVRHADDSGPPPRAEPSRWPPVARSDVLPRRARPRRSSLVTQDAPAAPPLSEPAVSPGARPGGRERSASPSRRAPAAQPVVPTRRQRRAARRLQARKVGRLVRHVDLWSVFKLALLFHLCAFLITLVTGSLLWAVGVSTGVIGDLEGFLREAFALESFAFDGERIFRAAVLGGLALVVAATAVTVLLAALLNLTSDLVGGLRVTVVEEETARPRPRRPSGP